MKPSSDKVDSAGIPDVSDQECFDAYLKLRSEWIEAFNAPTHGIWSNLNGMIHRLAVHDVISKQREERGYEESNASVIFHQGYLALQVLGIRRLISTGRRDNAVGTLLVSAVKNRTLITRENYLAACDIPYDIEQARLLWHEEAGPAIYKQAISIPSIGPKAWGTAMRAHQSFDRLSGVEKQNRSRSDLINLELLKSVQNRMEEQCRGWGILVDKIFAHAAKPEDFEKAKSAGHFELAVDNLKNAIKALYQAASFVYGPVIYQGGRQPNITYMCDPLENVQHPMVHEDDLPMLEDRWNALQGEIEKWCEDDAIPKVGN